MKKLAFPFVFLLLLTPIALVSWEPNEENFPKIFEQHPPIPTEYWVQQLNGHSDGDLILEIKYESDFKLPETLEIYLGKNMATELRDNGVFPDLMAEDMNYTALIKQNSESLKNEYLSKQDRILQKGYLFNFTGHIGKMLSSEEIIKFDKEAFDNFQKVQLDPMVVNETVCDDYNAIKKQQSLLITDLRVVEDPARTYNVVEETGNPIGAWTFGALMKNMAGGFSTPPTLQEEQKVKEFLKKWVLSLANSYQVNGITAYQRDQGYFHNFIIKPWLSKTYGFLYMNNTVNQTNWEQYWDDANVHDLLINAPFKLTAIVNRMDLRGSGAYGNDLNNAGETRFVYSLVCLYDNYCNLGPGMPPFHQNTSFVSSAFIDWQGMNVILEYGNIETDKCAIKQRALDWISLSSYDLDHEHQLQTYLNSLQELTNTVTLKNASPNRPNGSAINQVRSNEKLLSKIFTDNEPGWKRANWQLRQFEVEEDGWLVNAPVSNVPFEHTNFAVNNKAFTQPTNSTEIIDWIYGINQAPNFHKLRHGNHALPDNLTEPVAEIKDELAHYYGIDFWHEDFPDNVYDTDESSLSAKEIRRQLSLNSCMGCHGGETKTPFTMIRPLGYGQEANYWSPMPSTTTGPFDHRSNGNSTGSTFDLFLQASVDNYPQNYYTGSNRTIPNVSPFLTGRNYRGEQGLWQDDEFANDDDDDNLIGPFDDELFELGDNQLTGMFYVNDPSNDYDGNGVVSAEQENYVFLGEEGGSIFPRLHNSEEGRVGFNDLLRRQTDLCNLANSCCDNCPEQEPILHIIRESFFIPLPQKGH